VEVPETRFAKSGDVHVAYKVYGHGRFEVVFVGGLEFDTVEGIEIPPVPERVGAFLTEAGSSMRLIRFDKRGTGSSDRVAGVPSLEERMDDVRAVMDAVGSEGAALFGMVDGAAMSLLFAATYPKRTFALVLWQPKPRFVRAPDFQWAPTRDEYERETAQRLEAWVTKGSVAQVRRLGAALGGPVDEEFVRRQALLSRLTVSPGGYLALRRMNMEIDVRQILPSIHVPTLLVHRTADRLEASDTSATEIARYMAERMPNARTHEVPRDADWEHDGLLSDPVMEFLGEAWEQWSRRAAEPQRVLATVLFTDIVDSTRKAVELGPRWQELLREHNALVRRELSRYQGREIDTAGDGFFASGFDGPARAIRCGCAIRDAVGNLGLGIRVGVHTGECDLVDDKLSGLAVNIGARVATQAEEGEVLVSGTVKDLVAGSGIAFEARGIKELKGLGEWPLFAVAEEPAT
jgi:class 3 adenylate cyclase